MHYAVLGTAVAEDYSREATSGNLYRYSGRVHARYRALAGLRIAIAQLADLARECDNACVCTRHPDSETALSLIALRKNTTTSGA